MAKEYNRKLVVEYMQTMEYMKKNIFSLISKYKQNNGMSL